MTDYPHFPQDNILEYLVFSMTGVWQPVTMELSILTQSQFPNNMIITPVPYKSPAFIGTAMQWSTSSGIVGGSLKNGVAVSNNGKYYMGEGVNELDHVIYPPEALLTATPIATEIIDMHSRILKSPWDNTVIIPDFHWRYRTIAHYDTWGHHTDCWRTALWEYSSSFVYNYVFARDVGMVDFWYGNLSADNQVTGMRLYYLPE